MMLGLETGFGPSAAFSATSEASSTAATARMCFMGCFDDNSAPADNARILTNRALGCDLFEGAMKEAGDSVYSLQLRSATEECRGGSSIGFGPESPSMRRRISSRRSRRH